MGVLVGRLVLAMPLFDTRSVVRLVELWMSQSREQSQRSGMKGYMVH